MSIQAENLAVLSPIAGLLLTTLRDVSRGLDVVEGALKVALSGDLSQAPFPLVGQDAQIHMEAQKNAYLHVLEMCSAQSLKEWLAKGRGTADDEQAQMAKLKGVAQGFEVIEAALKTCASGDLSHATFPFVGEEARLQLAAKAAAYLHALEMCNSTSVQQLIASIETETEGKEVGEVPRVLVVVDGETADTDPNEFLLSEYSKYAEHVAEGDPMAFDDWLAGSDLPEIVKAREIAKVQERNLLKFAAGEWNHLFGVGNEGTRCRIVIDLERSKMIAAQEWTGLKFEDMRGDRLKDLAESVIEVNEAHANLDDWNSELTSELPAWADLRILPSVRAIEALALLCQADGRAQAKGRFAELVGMSPDRFVSEVDGGHARVLAENLAARFSDAAGAVMQNDLNSWLAGLGVEGENAIQASEQATTQRDVAKYRDPNQVYETGSDDTHWYSKVIRDSERFNVLVYDADGDRRPEREDSFAEQVLAVAFAEQAVLRVRDRELSNYTGQLDAKRLISAAPAELALIRAAVENYRDLVSSPTSADRSANGDDWADREVQACDALLQSKLQLILSQSLETAEGPQDFTVRFEVSITASSPEEAAGLALDDLRDTSLGPWSAEVVDSLGGLREVSAEQADTRESYATPSMR